MVRSDLFDALKKRGWVERDGCIYAPRATMWLDDSVPWGLDWNEFGARMIGRRERLVLDQGIDEDALAESMSDVSTLIEALEELLRPGQ